MESSYVTSKGQLVIPAKIRKKYGIRQGTRVNFIEKDGELVFQPVTPEYIDSFCGVFNLKPGEKSAVAELIEERRAERAKNRVHR
jgi:AbrB family looped-hinge helix DNA binding protein